MERLEQYIEAILFASETPVQIKDIIKALNPKEEDDMVVEQEAVKEALDNLKEKFTAEDFAIEIKQIGGGYQFLTKTEYHETISMYLNQKAKKRLSNAALETLSIIAYKQPVTKSEVEQIRGVGCDYAIQKLLEKELVEISGRAKTPGRPLLYAPSENFMDYFGLEDLNELPQLRDIQVADENTIGAAPEIISDNVELSSTTIAQDTEIEVAQLTEESEEKPHSDEEE